MLSWFISIYEDTSFSHSPTTKCLVFKIKFSRYQGAFNFFQFVLLRKYTIDLVTLFGVYLTICDPQQSMFASLAMFTVNSTFRIIKLNSFIMIYLFDHLYLLCISYIRHHNTLSKIHQNYFHLKYCIFSSRSMSLIFSSTS